MKTPNPMFFLIFCCVGLLIIFVWFFGKSAKKPQVEGIPQNPEFVEINGNKVKVEIAKTPAQRAKGLMFRTSMPQDSGMLFIFESESRQSFWMANTKIPLDIIWISRDGIIVDISHNTPPCTQTGKLQAMCKTYSPKEKALYVLEVNGGWANTHGIKINEIVIFKSTM
jgi:uncharacterized membrane protein (UPF0127 family)